MGPIGRIERIPLREVWEDEARNFTPWLKENIDVLNDVHDLTLSSVEREQSAGDFSVDLTAEDESGNSIIIENQLEKSDHDHLGKIITYLTAIEAKSAIWITSDPRPEHVTAINWLNGSTAASFYLIKVEAIKIEGSLPAPLLTLIVGPSLESKTAGETKKFISERHKLRNGFWMGLLEMAKGKTRLHANISPGQSSFISTGAGKYGLYFQYDIRKHNGMVELYIDRGAEKEEENKAIFDTLQASKESIEQEFGGPLEWKRLDGKRACRIVKTIELGGYRDDEEEWPKVQDAMIDAMIRLEKALRPRIENLQI
jgi:hypothetical protein